MLSRHLKDSSPQLHKDRLLKRSKADILNGNIQSKNSTARLLSQEDSANFELLEKPSNLEQETEKLISGTSVMVGSLEKLNIKEVNILREGEISAEDLIIKKESSDEMQEKSYKMIPKPSSQVLLSRVASKEQLQTDAIQRLNYNIYLKKLS